MAQLTQPAIPIVALDVPSAHAAFALVDAIGEHCRFYKVGNELFTAEGPAIVRALRDRGAEVFLDLKFHDIPNTVAGGVRQAAALGARLVTVHASGGVAMLRAAVDAAGDQDRCGILAVTVLTSLSGPEVGTAWGRAQVDPAAEALRLAGLAADAGAHGVVCSGLEVGGIRAQFGQRLKPLVPGVRPAGTATDDQARVVTPGTAARDGAAYVVIGRAVTRASDPASAMSTIAAEVAAAVPGG